MAKRLMGVKVIDPASSDTRSQQLLQMVGQLARGASIPTPEVGVYESPDINAFATGPTKKRSLVAVSSGLLQKLDRDEVEGVLSHEISHIANGDMVTMTLLTGVVNAFVMFLARVIAFAIAQALRRDDSEGISRMTFMVTTFALEMVFMIFGSMVVAAFSRHREFRADAGGARLAGADKMANALEALRRDVANVPTQTPATIAAMQISSPSRLGMLFASHPPLEERITRLRSGAAL
jgi:heat shock protein HtpX